MDQGAVSTTGTHYARLLLIFFGAVLGFLVLSFVFGSSPASADDGAGTPGLLGSAEPLARTATETVAVVTSIATEPVASPVTAIATPATGAVDEAVTALVGDAAGNAPVTSLIVPVTALADTALAQLQDGAGHLLTPVTGTLGVAIAPAAGLVSDAATASVAVFSSPAVLGSASGLIGSPVAGGLAQPDATGAATASGALVAIAAGTALASLLMLRRRALLPATMPGAPVYDTGSSPD